MADKTGQGLVEYVKSKLGTPYVYGAKMEILTREKYDWLKRQYGSLVWDSDVSKVGKMCCDCSGLISAYTGVTRGSQNYHDTAKQVQPISTVATAPIGALVWKQGHIGVYVGVENGTPMYIAEDGSASGCCKRKLPGVFTHWFLCNDIQYQNGAVAKPPEPVQGEITPGSQVKIKLGTTYGGLSSTRGMPVPASVAGRRMTVSKIESHYGVKEALLTEINSWVPLDGLERE